MKIGYPCSIEDPIKLTIAHIQVFILYNQLPPTLSFFSLLITFRYPRDMLDFIIQTSGRGRYVKAVRKKKL